MFTLSQAHTPRDRRNLRRVAIIQVVWLACLVASGSRFQHLFPGPIRILVALLPLMAGIVVIWSYAQFVRHADDLQKAIQLGGLAIGFGVSVVVTLTYPALERLGMPQLEPNHFAAIGLIAYFLATVVYSIRYQ